MDRVGLTELWFTRDVGLCALTGVQVQSLESRLQYCIQKVLVGTEIQKYILSLAFFIRKNLLIFKKVILR
jgi:hypothetical protein